MGNFDPVTAYYRRLWCAALKAKTNSLRHRDEIEILLDCLALHRDNAELCGVVVAFCMNIHADPIKAADSLQDYLLSNSDIFPRDLGRIEDSLREYGAFEWQKRADLQ